MYDSNFGPLHFRMREECCVYYNCNDSRTHGEIEGKLCLDSKFPIIVAYTHVHVREVVFA